MALSAEDRDEIWATVQKLPPWTASELIEIASILAVMNRARLSRPIEPSRD